MRLFPRSGEPLLGQRSVALILVNLAGGWNVLRDLGHLVWWLA